VVLDRGDAGDAYCFSRNIPGADAQALYERLIELGEDDYAEQLADEMPEAINIATKAPRMGM